MLKSLFPTFFLFLASGLTALWISGRDELVSSESTKWFSVSKNQVREILLTTKKEKIDFQRDVDRGFWVTISPKDKPDVEGYKFRASEDMEKVINGLDPLYARRIVGKAADLKLEEFGFSEDSPLIKVALKNGEVRELTYGKRSYGSGKLYVKDSVLGSVALVDADIFDLLKRARSSLIERNVWDPVVMEEANKGKVVLGNKEVDILKDSSPKKRWISESENVDTKVLNNWLSKLGKLRVQDYPNKEAVEALKKLEPLFSLKIDKDGEHTLSMYRTQLEKDEKPSYWVRTSYLNGFGKVSFNRSETLDKDLKSMFGP